MKVLVWQGYGCTDVHKMIGLLDEADSEDFYGTEGWKHSIGWD